MQYAQRLDEMERRFEELTAQMANPAVISDSDLYRKTTKAQSELSDVVSKYREYKHVRNNLDEGRAMLNESDPEMREMAQDEVQRLQPRIESIQEELKFMLLPKDPLDDKNVV